MANPTPVMDPVVADVLREFADATVGGLRGEEAVSLSSAILGRGRLPRPASALARAVEETFDDAARALASAILRHVGCELLHGSEELGGTLWKESDPEVGGALDGVSSSLQTDFDHAMTSATRIRALLGEDAKVVLEFFEGRRIQGPAPCLSLLQRAQRLTEDDETLDLLALAFCLDGQPRSALQTLIPLLDRSHRPALHNSIEGNVGLAYSKLGEHGKAALVYSQSALRNPSRMTSAISWLLNALQAGDPQSATRAAQFIEAAPAGVHEFLGTAAEAFRSSRIAGHWAVKPTAREALRQIASQLGPLSRQVTDVVH